MRMSLVLSLLFGFFSTSFAAITASLDSSSIAAGETVRLIITQDGAQNGLPNLTPLQKDFSVIGTEENMSYAAINGQVQHFMQWVILLLPRHEGSIQIPSLQFGDEKTTALDLTVSPRIAKSAKAMPGEIGDEPAGLITSLDHDHVFLNQQIIYTIKFYHRQNLFDLEYQPPHMDDALMVPLGDVHRYRSTQSGKIYGVEEQHYAIFPQRLGTLTVHGPSLKGLSLNRVTAAVDFPSEDSVITVKAIPDGFTNETWFPAENLVISEVYDKPPLQLEQGSLLTRTITLEALGLPGELIPNLSFAEDPKMRLYVDKAKLSTEVQAHHLNGKAVIKLSYFLQKPGELLIPEIKLPWFNTKKQKKDWAVLPPQKILVTPSEGAQSKDAHPSPPEAQRFKVVPKAPEPKNQQPESFFLNRNKYTYGPWFGMIFFALLWLATLLYRWKSQIFQVKTKKKILWLGIKQACDARDPEQVQTALLDWSRAIWPEKLILTLSDLEKWMDDPKIKTEIQSLIRFLYDEKASGTAWDPMLLWRALQRWKPKKTAVSDQKKILPDINP